LKRRDFLKSTIGAAAVATNFSCFNSQQKPNIILIMADDLGYGDVGCYGNDWINTPNIDALAKGGLKFLDYHSNCPVCSPTRAALLTGRYQQRAGIDGVVTAANHRHTGLDVDEVTFADVLKSSGYKTATFGKWHVGYSAEFNPVKQGFDEFIGYVSGNVDYQSHIDQAGFEDWWKQDQLASETGYVTDLVSEHGVDFIKRFKDKPFCLYLAHESPHYPYQGPDDPPDRSVGNPLPTQGTRLDKKSAYKEMIESLDKGVGDILKAVQNEGIENDTFIFFCSDNGFTGPGSAGVLRGKKGTLWEGGTRVPAIAFWPGKIKPGLTTNERVASMDLFPTFLALAGIVSPADLNFDGFDISSVLLKMEKLPPRNFYFRFKNSKAVMSGPWKYHYDGNENYLFNLEKDLGEQENLAEKYPNKLRELMDKYQEWEQDVTRDVVFRT
jgi:arylsulfatase A